MPSFLPDLSCPAAGSASDPALRAVRAFGHRPNLAAGGIHFRRGCKIIPGSPTRFPRCGDRAWAFSLSSSNVIAEAACPPFCRTYHALPPGAPATRRSAPSERMAIPHPLIKNKAPRLPAPFSLTRLVYSEKLEEMSSMSASTASFSSGPSAIRLMDVPFTIPQGKNAQQALGVNPALVLFHPDGALELVGLLKNVAGLACRPTWLFTTASFIYIAFPPRCVCILRI